jgi:hypothetical protein
MRRNRSGDTFFLLHVSTAGDGSAALVLQMIGADVDAAKVFHVLTLPGDSGSEK